MSTDRPEEAFLKIELPELTARDMAGVLLHCVTVSDHGEVVVDEARLERGFAELLARCIWQGKAEMLTTIAQRVAAWIKIIEESGHKPDYRAVVLGHLRGVFSEVMHPLAEELFGKDKLDSVAAVTKPAPIKTHKKKKA